MQFNGINPRHLSPKIFPAREIIDAIPPRTLRTLETARGPLFVASDLQAREITVQMNFAGTSHEHANKLVSMWNEVVCTGEPGELEPTHMPGLAFTAVLESAGEMSWRWGFGTIDYKFQALRPFAHSTAETVLQFSGSVRADPRGTVPVRPVIKHEMAAEAEELVLTLGGLPFFRLRPLTGTFPQGAVLRVDFENRLVTLNGDNAMPLVDYTASTWHPEIKSGAVITMSDAGPSEMRWRDEWM